MLFSIVIPVYNRPDEVDELLQSLTKQSFSGFEVLIIEDGSKQGAHNEVKKYEDKLVVKYFYKENTGPGDTRNYGSDKAHGEYVIFLDSDCIAPPEYLSHVNEFLKHSDTDAFGGPDMAHPEFTPIQKAISYAMTSFFTTGGIRGGEKSLDKYHPRSFNMGVKRNVFYTIGGFSNMRFGEDIDLSARIIKAGYTTALIPKAGVYHKRRTGFRKFFKQVFNSGIARINLEKRHPGTLKWVHALPAFFVIGHILLLSFAWLIPEIVFLVFLYVLLVFFDSLRKNSFRIGILSIIATYTQLIAYGCGFLKAYWKRFVLGKSEFHAFKKNFYK